MMCEVCFYNRIQVGLKDSFGKGQWKKAPVSMICLGYAGSSLVSWNQSCKTKKMMPFYPYHVSAHFNPSLCFVIICVIKCHSPACHHLCHQMSQSCLSTHAKYNKYHTSDNRSLIIRRIFLCKVPRTYPLNISHRGSTHIWFQSS